ncbi:unnamed protein product [Ilex paraguariensis]|uniref:PGG domain-containing protein n=1 Tax=Ilex paraguariensis TaxID=185542 RepID=A0ABC8V5D6_9AQUA
MNYSVDVAESTEISSVGDYEAPLLFGLSRVSDRPFGDYSDASPEKEVGASDKFYFPISQFDVNVFPRKIEYLLIAMCSELPEISRSWWRTLYSPTNFGDCKQCKTMELPRVSSSCNLPLLDTCPPKQQVFEVKIAHKFSSRNNANLDTCCQKRVVANSAIGILSEMKDGFECEEELNDYGNTPLHVAASNGDLEILISLIARNANECLRRDKHGGTPLHAAARRGRVEALKVILEACPKTVKMVTVPGENCLHTAVLYNQVGAVRFLVEWLERNREYAHLINGKDYDGKTPLHLAISRKQIQTLKVLLTRNQSTSELVDVNATSCGGFTALDILDVLEYSQSVDVEVYNILHQAGALRARDLANRDTNQYAAQDDKRKGLKTTDKSSIVPSIRVANHHMLLLMATMVTTITYQAALHSPDGTFKAHYSYNYTSNGSNLQLKKQESIITQSFLLFNSIGFVGSLAVVIFLLHGFPLKPWPQITVSMLFGSYMCCIMSISPNEAWFLLFFAIPFLLLAAAGKLIGLGRQKAFE